VGAHRSAPLTGPLSRSATPEARSYSDALVELTQSSRQLSPSECYALIAELGQRETRTEVIDLRRGVISEIDAARAPALTQLQPRSPAFVTDHSPRGGICAGTFVVLSARAQLELHPETIAEEASASRCRPGEFSTRSCGAAAFLAATRSIKRAEAVRGRCLEHARQNTARRTAKQQRAFTKRSHWKRTLPQSELATDAANAAAGPTPHPTPTPTATRPPRPSHRRRRGHALPLLARDDRRAASSPALEGATIFAFSASTHATRSRKPSPARS
jgi:hypothetical protein